MTSLLLDIARYLDLARTIALSTDQPTTAEAIEAAQVQVTRAIATLAARSEK